VIENHPIEAMKTAYRQIKEGQQLVLVIHPDDLPDWLALLPLGSRIAFAAVPIADDETVDTTIYPEEPMTHYPDDDGHRTPWADMSPVQQAGIRCNDEKFQEWLGATDAKGAAEAVRTHCGVKSRAELRDNENARAAWSATDQQYREWLATQSDG